LEVGIIGFGRLGKLASKYLSEDFTLKIYDKNDFSDEISKLGASPATLKEVCSCPVVIPFVPIGVFEKCIEEISPLLQENALVIDVCSVKEVPVKIMEEKLPQGVQILGTHPMFGPDSAKDTVFGTKIALCPVRIKDDLYQKIVSYLNFHGIKTIHTTAKDHDQQISKSLILTHLIGRTLIEFGAHKLEIDTKGYRRLLKILQTVENDSWELFEDMNRYNAYAKEIHHTFRDSLDKIIKMVED
jgi:prephenate dehydrogenase